MVLRLWEDFVDGDEALENTRFADRAVDLVQHGLYVNTGGGRDEVIPQENHLDIFSLNPKTMQSSNYWKRTQPGANPSPG